MKTAEKIERPKQEVPTELVNDLLSAIRRQFVPEIESKEWYKEHNQFIKMRVVLWPAAFVTKKGFNITAERYKTIMLAILNEIKAHGQTGQVRYWPGYLMKCVQEHWKHNWERYYQESKSVSNNINLAMGAIAHLSPKSSEDQVTTMATAYQLLSNNKSRKKKLAKIAAPTEIQQSLF